MDSILKINFFEKQRVFLATADSVVQEWFPETRYEIIRQIKLLTLLGYEVVLGTPFVWQSKYTRHALDYFSPFVEANLIRLMGRPGIRSASDYLAAREDDTKKIKLNSELGKSVFFDEVPTQTAKRIAYDIDKLSSLLQRRGSVERYFKDLFLNDLKISSKDTTLFGRIRTELPTRFSSFSWRKGEYIYNLLEELAFRGHFSRATIESMLISNHLPTHVIRSLNMRNTGLYHAANALACDSMLFTWAPFGEALPLEITNVHQFSLSPVNPYLFEEALNIFGISKQVIDDLPLNVILSIVNSAPEVIAFVSWYKDFIYKCIRGSKVQTSDNLANSYIVNLLSRERESAIIAQKDYETAIQLKKNKISYLVGILGAIVSKIYGIAPGIGYGIGKNTTDWSIKQLIEKCEKSLIKPLGDFEAFVINKKLGELQQSSDITKTLK